MSKKHISSDFDDLLREEDLPDVSEVTATERVIASQPAVSLEERAKRGNREKFEAALAKLPAVEPEEYDKL
ncbi:MAG TPA: toxin-antitoxin system HicB family antitoxin [Thermoanaerobaculia bacterium]